MLCFERFPSSREVKSVTSITDAPPITFSIRASFASSKQIKMLFYNQNIDFESLTSSETILNRLRVY